jgi:urease accessory protein
MRGKKNNLTENEKLLNLLRTSDSFFPMGSFAMSQGMEQIINEDLLPKEKVAEIIKIYLEKIWKTFDLGIFYQALEAIEKKDIDLLKKIDEICYSSKVTEENRSAIVKMGRSMINATEFKDDTIGKTYRGLVKSDDAYGTYPVVLALVSVQFSFKDLGALSLLYVNMMEVIASLVRMGVIDYIEAQKILIDAVKSIQLKPLKLTDLHQTFPLADIASIRHELSTSRMFMS